MGGQAVFRSRSGTLWWRWLVVATIASLALSLVPVTARVTRAAVPLTVDTTTDLVSANATACATAVTGQCSLRQAIREANAAGVATTIALPPGTYTLTLPGSDNTNAAGDLDIATTANVTLIGTGTAPKIIDGNASDRVFDVQSGGSLTIGTAGDPDSGVTIRNGSVGARGGGIRIQGAGTLAVNESTVTGNRTTGANEGGGISAEGSSTVTLTNTTVSNNLAGGDGGGIARSGSGPLTLTNSTVTGNNSPTTGGGILYNSNGVSAVLNVTGSTISGNSSGLAGGGLALVGAANASNAVTGSTISGNQTAGGALAPGGGVYVSGSSIIPSYPASVLSLTNATISGNSAGTQPGGGIASGGLLGSPTTTLTNVTVANNSTGISRISGTFSVRNSIIANSTAGTNCSGTISEPAGAGYNVDSGTSCGFNVATNHSKVSTDPLLGSLAVNAPGTTATHALQPASPAVGMVPSGSNCPATDQRGVARPQPALGSCEAGAYELLPVPAITSVSADNGTTSGGTLITITGTDFQSGATVTVGGNTCANVIVSNGTPGNAGLYGATTITCTTPAGVAGAQDVVVTNPDGGSATGTGAFTYVAPTVTSIAPTSGPSSGGTAVTITGTLFDANATVTIGGAPCTGVVVNSATSISCTTPAGTPGLVNVVVTNPNAQGPSGQATLTNGFEYLTTQGRSRARRA